VIPYTLEANDMRFATPQGFNSGDQFFTYLKDAFDYLYEEGATAPKMMSIGLHCRYHMILSIYMTMNLTTTLLLNVHINVMLTCHDITDW
jgi:peptidoglycan/xylan/chitin deacetylase (PgdA/CDA1 family)